MTADLVWLIAAVWTAVFVLFVLGVAAWNIFSGRGGDADREDQP